MTTIDKRRGEGFTISATFQNAGDAPGTWSVNTKLVGEWSWTGTAQNLTLAAGEAQTLTWNGTVPSVTHCLSSQLIIVADSTDIPQDWWIHVIGEALLVVTASIS